jgi:hypothetical protein
MRRSVTLNIPDDAPKTHTHRDVFELHTPSTLTGARGFEIAYALSMHLTSGVLPTGAATSIEIPSRTHSEGSVRIIVHAKMLRPSTGECVTFRASADFDHVDPRPSIRKITSDIVKKLQTVR